MEDRRLVQLALIHKMVTEEQLATVTKEQQQLADRGINRSIWFLLTDLGYLSDEQARQLRKHISSSSIRALEIGGYVLQGRIGSGGMGDVFRGRNPQGEEAAIKLLSAKSGGDAEHARRFQREARAGLRLVHPHITRSLMAGENEGQHYLIMELINGPSLKQRICDGGRMGESDALVLIWQIASALDYAWGHGVLHRDIKPANLMLGPARSGVQEPFCAKVCDFGLAKVWQQSGEEPDSTGKLTGTGLALGTPHYMSPEQASGEQDLDQRADIYSLGASVYNALLAKTVHVGKSSTAIMYKQVTESVDLRPLGEQGISAGTVKILQRMLERNRKQRYADWKAVLAAMRATDAPGIALQEAAYATNHPGPESSISSGLLRIQRKPGSRPSRPMLVVPATRSRSWLMPGLSALGAVMLILAGAVLLLTRSSGQHINPAGFAAALAGVEAHGGGVLILEAGDYAGPWHFGAADVGVTLRAGGPGVRLVCSPANPHAPLQLEPGLHDFRLAGVEVHSTASPSIEALAGAQATLQNMVVPGLVQVSGAQLMCSGLVTRQGLRVDGKGHVQLDDCRLIGACALDVRDGSVQLQRCLVCGINGALDLSPSVIRVLAGRLSLDAVVVKGPPPSAVECTGISLLAGSSCSFCDVSVQGVAVGLHADDAVVESIDGLSLQSTRVALWWSGRVLPSWHWQHLALHAPEPRHGASEVHIDIQGARSDRLGLVPPEPSSDL